MMDYMLEIMKLPSSQQTAAIKLLAQITDLAESANPDYTKLDQLEWKLDEMLN